MSNRLFRLGGGAGVGSFIIVLDNSTITNPEALRIRQSYDCGESLYLSIIDEVTEEALLPLTGYVDEQNILHLSGRDFDDNKTYEIDIDEENNTVELNIVDGITMGEGTIPTEGGGGDAVIILNNEHPEPEDITDLKKLYRRDDNIPSNLQQPALIHTEGVDTITNAQVATNNVQVTASNMNTFFDSEFNNVVKTIGNTMNLFSFRVVEDDTPISAIRVGTSNNTGSITFAPAGTTTTLRIGKYFYIDYETGERVYNTDAVVLVDGITYTFDSDDEILEIETDSEDITIQSTENGRIIIYSIETQGDPVDEWALDPLDSIREREQAVSELENTLMDDHITPTETTVASHTTDIQNLKTGVRDLGNALVTTNSHIGNIKMDSINRLPQPAYEYLNQIYRVDGKYYECYISVPGDAHYYEWPFAVNGTSEITESNWNAFAGDVGHGFGDNTGFNECSKFYRNNGSVKLGSSSTVGYVDFNVNLTQVRQIEIDYSGYNTKVSHIIITIDGTAVVDTDVTGTEKQTYLFEQDCDEPEIKIETSKPEGATDCRAIVYGIRVHTGTPATYAWREISSGGGGGGDTPSKKGKFLPDINTQNITFYFKEVVDPTSGEGSLYTEENRTSYKYINSIGYQNGVPALHNPDPDGNGNDLWYTFVGEVEIDGTTYDRWFCQHYEETDKDWYTYTNVIVDPNADYVGSTLDVRDQVRYLYWVDDPEEPSESYHYVVFPQNIMPLRYKNTVAGIDWIFDYAHSKVVNSSGTQLGYLITDIDLIGVGTGCVIVEPYDHYSPINNFAVSDTDYLEYIVVNGGLNSSSTLRKLNAYAMMYGITQKELDNALRNVKPTFSVYSGLITDHPIDWEHRAYLGVGGSTGWLLKEVQFSCTYQGQNYTGCKITYDETNNTFVLTGLTLQGALSPRGVVNDTQNYVEFPYAPVDNNDKVTNIVIDYAKSLEGYNGNIYSSGQ